MYNKKFSCSWLFSTGDIDTKHGILHSYTLMPQLKEFNLITFTQQISQYSIIL